MGFVFFFSYWFLTCLLPFWQLSVSDQWGQFTGIPRSVFWLIINVTTVHELVFPTYIIFQLLTLNWHTFFTHQHELLSALASNILPDIPYANIIISVLSSCAVYEYVEYQRGLWDSDAISTLLLKTRSLLCYLSICLLLTLRIFLGFPQFAHKNCFHKILLLEITIKDFF